MSNQRGNFKPQNFCRKSNPFTIRAVFLIGTIWITISGCVSTPPPKPSQDSLASEAKRVHVEVLDYITKQQYDRAENMLLKLSGKIEKQLGWQHLLLAGVKKDLGFLYFSKGRYSRAIKRYESALAMMEKASESDQPEMAELLHSMARTYQKLGRISIAESFYKRSLGLMENALGAEDLALLPILEDLAVFYSTPGYQYQGEAFYRKCLTLLERHYGSGHLDSAYYFGCIADLYCDQRLYSKAEELYGSALEIVKSKAGKSQMPLMAWLWNGLAKLSMAKTQFVEAKDYVQKSLALLEKNPAPNYRYILLALDTLERLYWLDNRTKELEALHQRRVKIAEKYYGSEHPDFAKVLYAFSRYYKNIGQDEKAEELEERVKKIEGTL